MTAAVRDSDASATQRTTLRFVAGMPGLEEYTRYTLVGIVSSPVYWLECDDEPAIALPVAAAEAISPSYAFELTTADAIALGLGGARDALVLVVLTVSRERGGITANLMAPIVVNRATLAARQVILDGNRYPLRFPVESFDDAADN